MFEIKYTNNMEEIKRGFIRIHNRYMLRRSMLFSVVYLIAAVLGIDMIIKNPSGYAGYILTSIGLAMGGVQWKKPYMVRNRLIKTLEGLNDESYTARFYDDRIEIETDIIELINTDTQTEVVAVTAEGIDNVTNSAVLDNVENTIKPADKTVINIGSEELLSEEDEIMFRLFVNRSLVYIFPKRCMDGESTRLLRDYFEDKGI